MVSPHLLTVAGAAQALERRSAPDFPFNRAHLAHGTSKQPHSSKNSRAPAAHFQTTFKYNPYQLTQHAFWAYSLRVKNELDSLEQKLGQLVRLSQRLRSENQKLRQALAEIESKHRQCNDKVNAAKSRLEKLLLNLPEDA